MGNYASKLLSYTTESRKEFNQHQVVEQQAIMEDNSTPVLAERRVLGDPRSASAGIRRTPIEVNYTLVQGSKDTPSAIPKYLRRKQYLETDMDVVMPPLTPKKRPILKSTDSEQSEPDDSMSNVGNVDVKSTKIITPIDKERFIILGLDPRSPAADFDRTPILLPRSLALLKARSQENLSRRGSYEEDVYNTRISCQKAGSHLSIPEIRLTDTPSESLLNTVNQDKLLSTFQHDSDSSISKSEKEITVIKNPKFTNGEEESLISDEQTVDSEEVKDQTGNEDNCKNIVSSAKIKDDGKIKLWQDSISSEESPSGKEDWKQLSQEKASREDVIITFDKYTTISTSLKPVKTKEDFPKKGDAKGRNKRTAKVDVKLNGEKVFTPENKLGIEVHENRTPLGNRSNNGQMQRKPQQLLRGRVTPTRTQQENTPPCKAYGKSRNGTQWDPNSTVLI